MMLIVKAKKMNNNISTVVQGFKSTLTFLQFNVNKGIEGEKNADKYPAYSWNNREDRVIALVEEVNADIVCLQELRELPNTKPVEEFLFRLTKFGYRYVIQAPNPGSMAFAQVILWKKDKFFMDKMETKWLSSTPDVVSDDWNERRKFGHVLVGVRLTPVQGDKVISNAKPLFVFNTHFSMEEPFKTKAAENIVKMMNSISDNYILAGDFNFFPDPLPGDKQRELITQHLTDCGLGAKSLGGKELKGTFVGIETDAFKAPLPDLNNSRLDHVFCTKNLKVQNCVLYTKTMLQPEPEELTSREFPSDHLPLVVTFTE